MTFVDIALKTFKNICLIVLLTHFGQKVTLVLAHGYKYISNYII